jgi:hypothetical protein
LPDGRGANNIELAVTVLVFFGLMATAGVRLIHGGGHFLSAPTCVASLQVP